MADSPQLFKDDEQEQLGLGPTDDELRHLTGISPDEEATMDREAHNGAAEDIGQKGGLFNPDGDSTPASKAEINNAEKADTGLPTAAGAIAAGEAAGGLFSGVEGAGGFGNRLKGWFQPTKKKGVAGGITFGAVGLFMFFGGMASGPLELIHYGQILKLPFTHQTNASTSRMDKIYRFASERDIGETRLNRLGSKTVARLKADLTKNGISLETDRITGQLKAVRIDTSQNEKYKGMSKDQARAAIAADNGLPIEKVAAIGGNFDGGYKFGLLLGDADNDLKTSVVGGFVQDHNAGELSEFVRFRAVKAYLNLNNPWLHPLRSLAAKGDQAIADKARLKVATAAEDSRLAALAERSSATKAKIADIKSKLSTTGKVTSGVLLATGAVCIAKQVAHDVPEINRLNEVEPAMESAADALGTASEITYETTFGGQNFEMATLAAIQKNMAASDGTTPFASKGIQSLESGTAASGGVSLDPGIAAAFTPNASAKTVDADLNALGADALCSSAGQFIQIVAGGALLVTGIGGVLDAGLQLGTAAAASVTIGLLVSHIEKSIADKPLTGTPHQGALGGNIDAYGDVALVGMSGQAMGGVPLTATETAQLNATSAAQEEQQFKSESFASRIFDTHDYRSLVSHIIDSQQPNGMQNVASTMSSFFGGMSHVGSLFSSLASSLFPHAHAAPSTPYGFGMPEIGFSQSDLNNPLFQDPYANADAAAKLFDSGAGDGNMTYVQKAAACFGMNISQDANGDWGATAIQQEGGADPNGIDYGNANCNDNSTDWKRVRFFVLDTGLIEGYACTELDDAQSCTDSGFGSSSTSSDNSGSPVTASGSAAQLAQQLLNDTNFVPVAPGVDQDLQATAAGKTITNGDTCGNTVSVDANLLQVLLTASTKYKIQPINIITGHGCDRFLHPKGRASDIDFVTDLSTGAKTNFCAASSNALYARTCDRSGDDPALDKQFYQYIASILPSGGELGQNTCQGREGLTAPSGITFFGDGCNHQHIDLGEAH